MKGVTMSDWIMLWNINMAVCNHNICYENQFGGGLLAIQK